MRFMSVMLSLQYSERYNNTVITGPSSTRETQTMFEQSSRVKFSAENCLEVGED